MYVICTSGTTDVTRISAPELLRLFCFRRDRAILLGIGLIITLPPRSSRCSTPPNTPLAEFLVPGAAAGPSLIAGYEGAAAKHNFLSTYWREQRSYVSRTEVICLLIRFGYLCKKLRTGSYVQPSTGTTQSTDSQKVAVTRSAVAVD